MRWALFPDRPSPGAQAASIALVALVYFAAARFGLRFAVVAEQVTVVWPPSGIALAAPAATT